MKNFLKRKSKKKINSKNLNSKILNLISNLLKKQVYLVFIKNV